MGFHQRYIIGQGRTD